MREPMGTTLETILEMAPGYASGAWRVKILKLIDKYDSYYFKVLLFHCIEETDKEWYAVISVYDEPIELDEKGHGILAHEDKLHIKTYKEARKIFDEEIIIQKNK